MRQVGQGCSLALRCEVQLLSFWGERQIMELVATGPVFIQDLWTSAVSAKEAEEEPSLGTWWVKRDLGKKELKQNSRESERPAWWAEGAWPM